MKIPFLVLVLLVSSVISCDLSNSEDEPIPEIPGKLVYSAPDGNGRHQIYTSLTNGTKKKQLTQSGSEQAEFFNPSWSNDGTQIAFTSTLRSTSEGSSLYLMNADGSDLRPLKERPNTDIVTLGNNPKWSPDDSKIAFDWCQNCELGGNNFEIYAYDFETNEVAQVTDDPATDDFPTWSPNGNFIAFSSGREYVNGDTLRFRKDLYQININTVELTRLTTTGNATRPVWNPLESLIFYEWNIRENTVFKFDMNLSTTEKINSGLEFL